MYKRIILLLFFIILVLVHNSFFFSISSRLLLTYFLGLRNKKIQKPVPPIPPSKKFYESVKRRNRDLVYISQTICQIIIIIIMFYYI